MKNDWYGLVCSLLALVSVFLCYGIICESAGIGVITINLAVVCLCLYIYIKKEL